MLNYINKLRFHPDVIEGAKRVDEAYSQSDRLDNNEYSHRGRNLELFEWLKLKKPFFSPDEIIKAENLESKLTLIPNSQFLKKHNSNLVSNFDAETKIQGAFGIPIISPRKPFRTFLGKDMQFLATIVGGFLSNDADILLSHQNIIDSNGNYTLVRGGLYGIPKETEQKSQIGNFDDLIVHPEELILTPLRPLRMSFKPLKPFYDGRKIMQKVYDSLQ